MSHLQAPERIPSSTSSSSSIHRRASSHPPYEPLRQDPHPLPRPHVHSPRPESKQHNHCRHASHNPPSQHRTRRSTRIQPDVIDRLANVGPFNYHHEGPFDAACRERNISSKRSPINALKTTNEEALKATPRDKIADSVRGHRPLDGVAYYPPGTTDPMGQRYEYEEGYNMMTEDRGNFRRVPGMKFRDEDFKNDKWYMEAVARQTRWKPLNTGHKKNQT